MTDSTTTTPCPDDGNGPEKKHKRYLPFRMSKLFDRWFPGITIVFIFVKVLQLLKFFGVKPDDNGWRKATGIFMKNDYSRFMLGMFRLRYAGIGTTPESRARAKQILIRRLAEFLRSKDELHWAIVRKTFMLKRRKTNHTDIVETVFAPDGRLISITPYFDTSRDIFSSLGPRDIKFASRLFVRLREKYRHLPESKRASRLFHGLRRRLLRKKWRSIGAVMEINMLSRRLLTATYINFEFLPEAGTQEEKKRRFATPNTKIIRNPGFGLLCITARITSSIDECDLWMQYHHVPVDGMPMQEIMQELKKEWGTAGEVVFPAPGGRPETFYSGEGVFRARCFMDFSQVLAARKVLNEKFEAMVRGPVTMAGMILWGLAVDRTFADIKMIIPIDMAHPDKGDGKAAERKVSLVFIRPSDFMDGTDMVNDFVKFQHEFNRNVACTKEGKSESHEIMELYAMAHPLFYYIARYLMPQALKNVLGTMGISILRNAEIFIPPLSDFQSNGFISFGNMVMPSEDGKKVGAVGICGTRQQVRKHIENLGRLAENCQKLLAEVKQQGDEKK